MKIVLILSILTCLSTAYCNAQDTSFGKSLPIMPKAEGGQHPNDDQSATDNSLSPLLAFNFTGNAKNGINPTPVVNYGFTIATPLGKQNKTKWEFMLLLNPYVAGQISVPDSSVFVPALMLPGSAGITENIFFNYKIGSCKISFFPLNFGYKVLTNFTDSSKTVFQHNIRSGLAFAVADKFILGIQHTWGWHNSTSEGENTFKTILQKQDTRLNYLLISLQAKINTSIDKPTYFFAEWRGVTNSNSWIGFHNTRIVTVGIRKDISLNFAAPALAPRFHPVN